MSMDVTVLVTAIIACFLSVCAFIASAVTTVVVIGWSKSTHRLVQVPATEYVWDTPPQMPGDKQEQSQEDYILEAKRAAVEQSLYDDE